jgi:hypothetical protein
MSVRVERDHLGIAQYRSALRDWYGRHGVKRVHRADSTLSGTRPDHGTP